MLTDRFFLKADLTDTGLYTLSARAEEVLRGVGETVDIIVLSEESSWLANANLIRVVDILKNYSAVSGGRIRVQYVNPDLNSFNGPHYNNSLSNLKDAHSELENMNRNDIIFLSSRRATKVAATGLFTYSRDSMGNQVISGVRADQELVSSLLYVLNERVARAVFLEGHQERPAQYLMQMFDRSGYISSTINLALEDIPEDTVILFSVAPTFDFSDAEIIKLEHYLTTGGNAMIFYDFSLPSLPRLDTLLTQWGVSVENKMIFDEQFTFIPGGINAIGARVVAGSLPSTADAEIFTSTQVPVVIPRPRPLRAEWADGARGNFQLFPLISTFSSSSYAKDTGEGGLTTTERESGDESGPFTLAYHIRHITHDLSNVQIVSNLIVAGADMVDDSFLQNFGMTYYNIFLMADLANDLNPFGESVFIASKNLFDNHMPVSSGGARAVLVLMVIALPLAIILVGILVWRKRRHQ
jgi:hypothetical protein